jgi:hypothetical protein
MPVKKADYVKPYKSTTYARYPFCSVAVSFCASSLQCSMIFVHKSLADELFSCYAASLCLQWMS